jgi:hypothetical protein
MSVKDNREPIEPRHIAFAQALVALAREHGMRNLTADFYGGGLLNNERWTKVHISWAVGRHGDQSQISLRAEAIHHCAETTGEGDKA